MEEGLKIRVSGRVQGVGYRYYCASAARQLGLKGYVMNLSSGDVEMEIYGAKPALEAFMSEITKEGMAFRVEGMETEKISGPGKYNEFTIRFY